MRDDELCVYSAFINMFRVSWISNILVVPRETARVILARSPTPAPPPPDNLLQPPPPSASHPAPHPAPSR